MKPDIFEPHSELAAYVKCYWTLEGTKEETPQKNTIVPDGTMKLIFHYKDSYRHYPENGTPVILPHCFLIGQLTKPYVVEPLGETGSFIVRFHPHGFLPFTSFSLKAMENTALPIEHIFGEQGHVLGQNILKASSHSERIQLAESFLRSRLREQKQTDEVIQSTIDSIQKTKGQFSVSQFAEQHNINRRLLLKRFSSLVGLSPKQLSKTVRVQSTLKTLLTTEVTSLTSIAYENEYYDQAHFIKDFKEFTGLTPKKYLLDDLKMSQIFDKIK